MLAGGNKITICTLASGSSGNSLFIQTERAKILVDAGISPRQITSRLKTLGIQMSEIDVVLITHEHTDHIAALPFIKVPVYVASTTIFLWKDKVENLKEFDTGSPFCVNDALITPFPIPHDALDPVGFTIQTEHKKVGVVTDIGSVTALVRERLKGVDALILEFNHDEEMLLYGPYPWDLKQRIKGRLGHLSNVDAAGLLGSLIHDGLRYVILAHLSESNNTPKRALEVASSALIKNGGEQIRLLVAQRKTLGEILIL
jgi:phosphoribosyl 1,2-cyclic phosphodiesterase